VGIPARLTAKEGRRFAFTVGTAFLVLAAISLWRGHILPPRVLGALGAGLLLAGLTVPGRLGGVYRAWMGLANAMSKVTAPIMVGAVYFAVITPMGCLMRICGRNPVRHRERSGSFWVAASSGGRSNLDNQF
jgi:hypothetical protein